MVSCLCPTYRRPRLLANAVACFLAQDYPAERRELLILDDAGQFPSQSGPGWELISLSRRFRSLPEKYNALAGMAQGDILVVWEDDDIYLPWHLSAHVAALANAAYSKPSRVWSLYSGKPKLESSAGRFHASIACTRAAFETSGGWPVTARGDFDQQVMTRFAQAGPKADPALRRIPSYVFRWGSTGQYHGQAQMAGAADPRWYEKCSGLGESAPQTALVPEFDPETRKIFDELQTHGGEIASPIAFHSEAGFVACQRCGDQCETAGEATEIDLPSALQLAERLQPEEAWVTVRSASRLKGNRFTSGAEEIVPAGASDARGFPDGSLSAVILGRAVDPASLRSQVSAWMPKIAHDGSLYGVGYNRRETPYVTTTLVEMLPGVRSGPESLWTWSPARPGPANEPVPTLSVVVATTGRASLRRTLESIRRQSLISGDEILLVHDGPCNASTRRLWEEFSLPGRLIVLDEGPHRDWGATARSAGQAAARGSHLLWQDDDDTYLPGAFTQIRSEIRQTPEALLLFRLAYPNGWLLWRGPQASRGNVSTQIVVLPRRCHLGQWGKHYEGDFDFIDSSIKANPDRELRFVDCPIVMYSRPL